MKIDKKKSYFSGICRFLCHFLQIPDTDNVINRQRTFVFLYTSLGFLIGIPLNLFTQFGPQSTFIFAVNSVHVLIILALVILYARRILSIYWAIFLLIFSIQIEIPFEMIYMTTDPGISMGVPGILGNTVLLGIILILSITAHIRFLPYIQTVITIMTLGVCWYITQDPNIGHLIPVLAMAFGILSFMGERMVHGVASLQQSRDDLTKEQKRVFEFLNMNKEELFKLIKLTQHKKLTEKQKGKLLELLDEHTKTSVLEAAAEVVEKKKRNLSILGNRELGLTPYEKEICLLILKEMTVADIARKLGKTPTSITSVRASIRSKLKLMKEDNLYEALVRLVSEEKE